MRSVVGLRLGWLAVYGKRLTQQVRPGLGNDAGPVGHRCHETVVYLVTRGGGTNVWRQPIAGGSAVPATRFTDERIFRFSASPDQKRWAIVRGNIASDVVLVSERE